MEENDEVTVDDSFIMSPKVDFAFKLIFGDEKNKNVLVGFLSDVLKITKEEFEEITFLNTELLREFKEDRKGILDVRVQTKQGKQIDIEIQILPTKFMPERTLFYWSKMYNSQITAGDTYDKLKKCITINIVDFECVPVEKIHTKYHLTEDDTKYKLTDVLEIHFLELSKLRKLSLEADSDDSIVNWLKFIDSNSKEVMEMLAKKDENINSAYQILKKVSRNKEARMAYEARQAEIMDQMTREKIAREEGIEQGIEQGKKQDVINFLKLGVSEDVVAQGTGLTIETVRKLKNGIR